MCLLPTCLALVAWGKCVFGSPWAHFSAGCPTAVIRIKHIHFQKEIKSLFLPTISVLPLCNQSLQRFQPLATWAEAWQAIPGVSEWVMATIRRGYTLQFAWRPLRFRGVLTTTVSSEDAQVLHAEVMNLQEIGAIEIVPPAQSESGFYSCYFLLPQKNGGLRPILDLRLLNYAPMKRSFRMITLKQILSQICPGDWFMSLDLKDAYFHIQVAPSQTILEILIRMGGISIQGHPIWTVPGSPCTFKWCLDAALFPLQQTAIRMLIMAQSEAVLTSFCLIQEIRTAFCRLR